MTLKMPQRQCDPSGVGGSSRATSAALRTSDVSSHWVVAPWWSAGSPTRPVRVTGFYRPPVLEGKREAVVQVRPLMRSGLGQLLVLVTPGAGSRCWPRWCTAPASASGKPASRPRNRCQKSVARARGQGAGRRDRHSTCARRGPTYSRLSYSMRCSTPSAPRPSAKISLCPATAPRPPSRPPK
jgi:hypothetical protein